MQPPPYSQPPYPVPPPPRRGQQPLIIGLVAGAFVLLLLIAGVVVLVLSRDSSEHRPRASLQLRRVLTLTPPPCPTGDATRLTGTDGCYQLGDGMTVSQLRKVELNSPGPGQADSGFSVAITMGPQDAAELTSLTTQVSHEQQPRNQLAMVIDGKIVSAPQVTDPITGGTLILTGGFTRAQAQRYVDLLDH